MPTYKYKREDDTTFEIVQKISEDALETCPDTGQKVKRVPCWEGMSMIMGWSPGKELRKKKNEERAKANPHLTTLPEYQKRIDENTQKTREIKQKIKNGTI